MVKKRTSSNQGLNNTTTSMPKDHIVMDLQKQCRVVGLPDRRIEVANPVRKVYVGDGRGPDLIAIQKQLDAHKDKIASLEAANISLQRLRGDVDQLNDYCSTLRLSLKEYKNVRQRFIIMYKRDKLHMVLTPADQEIIGEGNLCAHTGDATVDALLYGGIEGRRDSSIFTKLYGLDPLIVKRIKHKETLAILNLHAEVEANTAKTGTEEFYKSFKVFVTEFEASDRSEDYLTTQVPTAVTQAYWIVVRCHKYQENE